MSALSVALVYDHDSRPALVEDVSDWDVLQSRFDCKHVQSTLELVDVDVASAQMTHSAVELECVARVQHTPVVEARHVTRLKPSLEPRLRTVDQVRERTVGVVVRFDVGVRHIKCSLERRWPCHADDTPSFRLRGDVRTSVSEHNRCTRTFYNVVRTQDGDTESVKGEGRGSLLSPSQSTILGLRERHESPSAGRVPVESRFGAF